jgi:hypothetical protein
LENDKIPIFFRLLGAAFFLFAALAPAWVLYWSLVQVIPDPTSFNWLAFAVISVSATLMYFFLLLACRSIAGRGRAKDDGLLPVWAMKGFLHSFAVIAILLIGFGVYDVRIMPIIGGALYLIAAYKALQRINGREQNGA